MACLTDLLEVWMALLTDLLLKVGHEVSRLVMHAG